MKRSLAMMAASFVLALAAGAAHAQSTPTTCGPGEFNELLVQVNGRTTTVESTPDGVLVNGVFCGWQDETSAVHVFGGDLNDRVTFRGAFIPGDASEPDWDELEVAAELGAGTDTVTFELSNGADVITTAGSSSFNVNNDGDDDVFFSGVEVLKLMALGGDDYVQVNLLGIAGLYLYGGDGNDLLEGSGFTNDVIDGGAGNDQLAGSGGNDVIIGGPGSDYMAGGGGFDTVDYRARTARVTVTIGNGLFDDGEAGELDQVGGDVEEVLGGTGNDILIGSPALETLNGGGGNDVLDGGLGGDVLIGGPGNDTADYSSRTTDVFVWINGFSDDGEASELDFVDSTVENVTGGSGDDTLIGSTSANTLRGGGGNDTLQGDAGNDSLYGDAGDDTLQGDAGADKLYGAGGADVLDGGADADTFTAGGGNDFLYNDDGVAETVNCGPGNADDAEVDSGAVDTFIGCEL